MLQMNRLDYLGPFENTIEAANQLDWNMRLEEYENKWFIWTGDQIILVTDNREAVDAFLYGLGLAYSILPDPAFEVIKKK